MWRTCVASEFVTTGIQIKEKKFSCPEGELATEEAALLSDFCSFFRATGLLFSVLLVLEAKTKLSSCYSFMVFSDRVETKDLSSKKEFSYERS